jgi:hypothetical protein
MTFGTRGRALSLGLLGVALAVLLSGCPQPQPQTPKRRH